MRYQIPNVRAGTLRGRRIAPAVLTTMLLGVSVLLAPSPAYGGFISRDATPVHSGDDWNFASLNPFREIPISSITYPGHPELNGQCSWINTGLAAFTAANPEGGTGPSGQEWEFKWAGVAQEAKVEAGIQTEEYFPYVVEPPLVHLPNGGLYTTGKSGELGGAVIVLRYTPQAGAPDIDHPIWIQALTGTLRGKPVPTILDNDRAHPFERQSAVAPWYAGAMGPLKYGGSWFADRPKALEEEYESNPVASLQFQAVLANDKTTLVVRKVNGKNKNVFHHDVTLYGGEWWGFEYEAVDTPEPASFLLMALGGGLLFFRRRIGWMPAA